MRVLMSGGGTGGHVNPAIAIADMIKIREPDSEIAFVGTERGIENKLVPAAGYKLYHVDVRGIRRKLTLENLRALWLSVTSVYKAKKLIREFRPDIVIGTGGYVCWPIVKAAVKLDVPSMLHESNAQPGMAVRMLNADVDCLLVNFEQTIERLERTKRAVHVGNPLRGEFASISPEEARAKLGIAGKYRSFLLSYGGSMGAERVNDEVLELMRDYSAKHPELLHMHATGSIEHEAASEKFRSFGLDGCKNIKLEEYIYDMPLCMAAADLVICRAGAITLSELAALGKPSILIPSPNVTDNHQYKNAKVLADAGAAVLIEEKELSDGRLEREVAEILSDKERMKRMSEAASSFSVANTDELIYSEIEKLVKK